MFSVIMPVWNRAALVSRSIESALGQTFDDFELIIVDDGSADDLQDVIRPYLSPTVRCLRTDHHGVCAARNLGLQEARHPFIAYLDSDNLWRPNYLERMAEALAADQGRHQAAYCRAEFHRRRRRNGPFEADGTIGQPFDFQRLLHRNYIDLNAFVHSRKCTDVVGGFDESLRRLVDWDLIIRIASRFELLFVPEVLVDYYHGIADNAITLKEARRPAMTAVRTKTRPLRIPITVSHDTIPYRWHELPAEKFNNWARLHSWMTSANEPPDTRDFTAYGYPYILQIEPTNLCNLACPLCPTGRGELRRVRRNMTLDEYCGIIDDMERWLMLAILWDQGEPTMNPQLPDMIRYTAARDIRTVTSTNGHFLANEDYAEALLTSGLTVLVVAIDSNCEESYQAYRQRGDIDRVMEGFRKLMEVKRRTRSGTIINMRMVVMRHNEDQVSTMRNLARELGADRFTVKTLNPSVGSVYMDEELVPLNPALRRFQYVPGTWERVRCDRICQRVWFMSNILCDGDAVACTYDFQATLKAGNVFETPLSELWNGPGYQALRKKVYEDRNSVPICRDCVINFAYTNTNWFPEGTDLKAGFGGRLSNACHNYIRRSPVRRILRAVRSRLPVALR